MNSPRILFCVIPEKGHLHPYIGPALQLEQMGATVAFYASHDISSQLARVGLSQLEGAHSASPPPEHSRGKLFAEQLKDAPWLRQWIKTLLVDLAENELAPIERAIETFQPTIIAIDPMVYAAAIAAHRARLPWVAISNSLNPVLPSTIDSELLRTVEWLAPERAALFSRHGMTPSFRGCDVLSPHMTIAFTTEMFLGHQVPGVHLVGPSLPPKERGDEVPFPWERIDPERPLVYASFGSQIYYQPERFRRIIDAVKEKPVQLVLSVSELLETGLLDPLPSNTIAVRYVPQLQLLPRTRLFITHGGANSVMEALAFGVPLLLNPLCNDQFHQSFFIEKAGVGRSLDLLSCDAHTLDNTIEHLLHDQTVRANVERVRQSYQQNGAAECARLLLSLATTSDAKSRPEPT